MANVKSNNIKVFPCVGRGAGFDPEAELTNEGNLSQIIRSLYKRESFVISDNVGFDGSGVLSNDFEFVIYGFYFKIEAGDKQLYPLIHPNAGTNNPLYAGIRINKSSNEAYQLLNMKNGITDDIQVLDTVNDAQAARDERNNSIFQGIVFDISEDNVKKALSQEGDTSDENIKILCLFDGNKIPNSSKLHFKTTEILNVSVDEEGENINTEDPISSSLTTSSLNVTTQGTIKDLTVNNSLTTSSLNVTTIESEKVVKNENIADNTIKVEKINFKLSLSKVNDSQSGDNTFEINLVNNQQ